MKVVVQGQGGQIELGQKEFVASGGEGSIFAVGDTAFKIFTDPSRMLPPGKITELSALSCDPNIIRPQYTLLDPKKVSPIGYTMRFVKDTIPLIQTLTRAFREREGLDHKKMLGLILRLKAMVQNTHKAGVLVVDLNELNYLVNTSFTDIFGIDVDSYQTPGYPATALMPSVRDYSVQNNKFTEDSDWFSFACVSYQMFTGIHPFKGKHPAIHSLEERMKNHVSVLDPLVSVPKVVYPEDIIPSGFRAWFHAVFVNRLRCPPPNDPFCSAQTVNQFAPRMTLIQGKSLLLDIIQVKDLGDDILGFLSPSGSENGSGEVYWTARGGVFYRGNKLPLAEKPEAVAFSPKLQHCILAYRVSSQDPTKGGERKEIKLYNATLQKFLDLPAQWEAEKIFGGATSGSLMFKNGERVIEIQLHEFGNSVIVTPRVASSGVAEKSSSIFSGEVGMPGVLIQDILGSKFVTVFSPSSGSYQIRVPELDSLKISGARMDGGVLMVQGVPLLSSGSEGKNYQRLTFILRDLSFGGKLELIQHLKDLNFASENFVVLDNGVIAFINEEEKLEIWDTKAPTTQIRKRIVEDPLLGGDMRLIKLAGKVGFIRDQRIFSMKLR